ncbi:MAG: hypothetical protein Q8P15_00265 [Nanoarchaeota archaeon]|nr:hypothetical protein [Nanoarchaeota archaeon]
MGSQGRQLHNQAEMTREKGDFLKALELSDQAMIKYQEENNVSGFAEIQASRFLTLRHLFEKTNDQNYLILAKHSALSAVEIAQKSGNKESLAIPLFNLAKAQETLGELSEAVSSYKEAVENMTNNPPQDQNRPAVLLDMKIHLDTAEYENGDKTALESAEKDLAELEKAEEMDYNKHVWTSGGYMRIADMLRKDNFEKAKQHLQKAKEIIDADPELILRKKQWQKLSEKF